MVAHQDTRPEELGRQLAELLRDHARDTVRGLWMAVHPGEITFWILTTPIDTDTQERLYEQAAALYEQFPDAAVDFHILNPHWYEGGDVLSQLPPDARPVIPVA
jgi:hypothetical protein